MGSKWRPKRSLNKRSFRKKRLLCRLKTMWYLFIYFYFFLSFFIYLFIYFFFCSAPCCASFLSLLVRDVSVGTVPLPLLVFEPRSFHKKDRSKQCLNWKFWKTNVCSWGIYIIISDESRFSLVSKSFKENLRKIFWPSDFWRLVNQSSLLKPLETTAQFVSNILHSHKKDMNGWELNEVLIL